MRANETPAAAPQPSDGEQWKALLLHRWGRRLSIAAVLALVAVAAFGGFRPARETAGQRHPVVGAGQRVETGAFALTPMQVWQADAPPGRKPRGGERFVVLRLRAENMTETAFAASALMQDDVVWLPDGRSNERKPEPMERADDHTLGVVLQPALPVVVDLFWKVPAGESVRLPPTFGVYARHYVERGYLQGEGDAGWKQGAPLAKLVLPAAPSPPEPSP